LKKGKKNARSVNAIWEAREDFFSICRFFTPNPAPYVSFLSFSRVERVGRQLKTHRERNNALERSMSSLRT
jgi:hypothetical protein